MSATFLKYRSILFLSFIGFLLYSSLVTFRYIHFAYNDWDMAFINQTLWNALHGTIYSSLFDFNYLGDHANFINLLILPLFALFPHPLTFSFVQIFLFIASGSLLYVMIREDLGKRIAFWLSFAYFIFPPNFFAMCHDHNPEALVPVFFLWMVFSYRRKNIVGFYISIMMMLIIKENMPLIVAMIALWGLCARDRNRITWGILPLFLSIAYFLLMVKWVIPYFRGLEKHSLWVRFNYLGNDPKEILFNLFQFKTLSNVFLTLENYHFVVALFGILLIPALLSPSILLLIAPIIAYHLISAHMPEKTIYYHYAVTMTPAIFLASIQTIKKIDLSQLTRYAICAILVLTCLTQLYFLRDRIFYKIGYQSDTNFKKKWMMVQKIPAQASVIATFEFLPALSLREHLYSFHKVYSEEYQNREALNLSDFYTKDLFKLNAHVTYALINFNDEWLQSSLQHNPNQVNKRIEVFLKEWIEIDSVDQVKLYKRKT